jgi:hypothetical protein
VPGQKLCALPCSPRSASSQHFGGPCGLSTFSKTRRSGPLKQQRIAAAGHDGYRGRPHGQHAHVRHLPAEVGCACRLRLLPPLAGQRGRHWGLLALPSRDNDIVRPRVESCGLAPDLSGTSAARPNHPAWRAACCPFPLPPPALLQHVLSCPHPHHTVEAVWRQRGRCRGALPACQSAVAALSALPAAQFCPAPPQSAETAAPPALAAHPASLPPFLCPPAL